jgi:hypothetical protein
VAGTEVLAAGTVEVLAVVVFEVVALVVVALVAVVTVLGFAAASDAVAAPCVVAAPRDCTKRSSRWTKPL